MDYKNKKNSQSWESYFLHIMYLSSEQTFVLVFTVKSSGVATWQAWYADSEHFLVWVESVRLHLAEGSYV